MSINKIMMPQLGESVTEGTISKWLVAPGDSVKKYDPLAEVTTDKVNAEVPSSYTGVIAELLAGEDETLAVGEPICTIETDESPEAIVTFQNDEDGPNTQVKADEAGEKMSGRFSPAVLKLSQEHGIDLSLVKGSGQDGRITRKDLRKLIQSGNIPEKRLPEQVIQPKVAAPEKPYLHESRNDRGLSGEIEVPINHIRKTIASHMVQSAQEIPHAWMMMEADVTNLVRYRDSLKDEFKRQEGFNLTYFAFFVKAVAHALREFPMMNAMWAGDKILQKRDINLSIAVASDGDLFVPVIQRADELSIKGIAREISLLASKARKGKLESKDIRDGTFTVNNTGAFGSIQSMGIINHPQAAILQVESIVKRPVVMENDGIAVRHMVNLCLSIDHRVLDGLMGGNFLKRVKSILENISAENTTIY